MPAMSSMDLVFALTMIVPSGIADQTRRVPGLACTRARMSAGTVVCPFEVMVDSAMLIPYIEPNCKASVVRVQFDFLETCSRSERPDKGD